MLLKKLSIFILLISLSALPSISYANDPNYKKFSSYFYNPVKWLKKYPLNEQTIDDLIMNLGSPDSFIENEGIYVIANGGATICNEVYDILNNSITGFNGNDVIGLFKNDILIDIIGTLGNSDTFAQNTTLVRNSNIAAGSSIFDIDQWDSYEINSCENLGIHNQVLDVENHLLNSIKLVSNPFSGNILEIISEKYYKYEILTISGIKLYNGNINPGLNQINNLFLSSGTYILKLISKNSIVVKKILKK